MRFRRPSKSEGVENGSVPLGADATGSTEAEAALDAAEAEAASWSFGGPMSWDKEQGFTPVVPAGPAPGAHASAGPALEWWDDPASARDWGTEPGIEPVAEDWARLAMTDGLMCRTCGHRVRAGVGPAATTRQSSPVVRWRDEGGSIVCEDYEFKRHLPRLVSFFGKKLYREALAHLEAQIIAAAATSPTATATPPGGAGGPMHYRMAPDDSWVKVVNIEDGGGVAAADSAAEPTVTSFETTQRGEDEEAVHSLVGQTRRWTGQTRRWTNRESPTDAHVVLRVDKLNKQVLIKYVDRTTTWWELADYISNTVQVLGLGLEGLLEPDPAEQPGQPGQMHVNFDITRGPGLGRLREAVQEEQTRALLDQPLSAMQVSQDESSSGGDKPESIVCFDQDCDREHAGGMGGVPVHPPAGARISGDEPLIDDPDRPLTRQCRWCGTELNPSPRDERIIAAGGPAVVWRDDHGSASCIVMPGSPHQPLLAWDAASQAEAQRNLEAALVKPGREPRVQFGKNDYTGKPCPRGACSGGHSAAEDCCSCNARFMLQKSARVHETGCRLNQPIKLPTAPSQGPAPIGSFWALTVGGREHLLKVVDRMQTGGATTLLVERAHDGYTNLIDGADLARRARSATAQEWEAAFETHRPKPVSPKPVTEPPDYSTDAGIVVALIDGIIATAHVIARNYPGDAVRLSHDVLEALDELRSDPSVCALMNRGPEA